MSFNARLCQVINDHGSNVSELARGIEVNRLTVHRWINGQRIMHTGNLCKIAELWSDVDLHWLITGIKK